MYFNTFIIIIILSYKCLITCSYRLGVQTYPLFESHGTGINDCSLLLPDKNDLKKPTPSTINSKAHFVNLSVHNGYLNVKHNSYFKLSCSKDRFMSVADKNTREIIVKCLKGDTLEFQKHKYPFDYFECGDLFDDLTTEEYYHQSGESTTSTTQSPNSNSTIRKTLRRNNSSSNLKRGDASCFIMVLPTDFRLPIPYLNIPRAKILRPGMDGFLRFKSNETFQLSCTNKEFQLPKLRGLKEATVVCLQNTLVSFNEETYDYYDFRCKEVPGSRLIMTSHKCQNNHSIAAVGFQAKYKYLLLYNICFDVMKKIPLYSWYITLSPHYSARVQSSDRDRPVFIKSKQFYGVLVDIHSLYKKQYSMMLKTLKTKPQVSKYFNLKDERFLARGHLVARTEFAYGFEQEATFYYENTAPTWQSFNKHTWKPVEKYLSQKLAIGAKANHHVIIAGTFGQCSLPDDHEVQKPLFLSYPDLIPVPLFFWKMDINMNDRNNAIVFIGLNNPHITLNSSMYMCKPTKCPMTDVDIQEIYDKKLIYCCTKRSFEYGYGSRIDPIIFHRNLK